MEEETKVPPSPRPLPGTAAKWPTRLGAKRALLTSVGEHKALDKAERKRWIDETVKILQRLQLPLALEAEQSLAPNAIWQRSARGKRAGTLRKWVREWRRMEGWISGTRGHPWPWSPK